MECGSSCSGFFETRARSCNSSGHLSMLLCMNFVSVSICYPNVEPIDRRFKDFVRLRLVFCDILLTALSTANIDAGLHRASVSLKKLYPLSFSDRPLLCEATLTFQGCLATNTRASPNQSGIRYTLTFFFVSSVRLRTCLIWYLDQFPSICQVVLQTDHNSSPWWFMTTISPSSSKRTHLRYYRTRVLCNLVKCTMFDASL